MGVKLAIMNADHVLGRELIEVLNHHQPDWLDELRLFGPADATYVLFGGKEIPIRPFTDESFAGTDIALMGSEREVQAGAVAIRPASAEDESDAPIIIHNINAAAVDEHRGHLLIPSASASALVQILHLLGDSVTQVNGCILQPVSVLGPEAIEELYAQTLALFNQSAFPTEKIGDRLAFNLLPGKTDLCGIGAFSQCPITLNAMLVPVFSGTTMLLSITGVDVAQAELTLKNTESIEIIENAQPAAVVGKNSLYVTNIHGGQGVQLTLVFDEIRRTAEALLEVAGEVVSCDAF